MNKKVLFLLLLLLSIAVTLTGLPAMAQNADQEVDLPVFRGMTSSVGVVVADYLNVRQGPSTDYEVLQVLKAGDRVWVWHK